MPDARAQEGLDAWIGLYEVDQLEWLENENRLDSLCWSQPDPHDGDSCARVRLAPTLRNRAAYSAPGDPDPLGWITIAAVPGRGLSSFWTPAFDLSSPAPFEPDVHDPDWGYGPYFHQSVLERRGDWFLLPADPFPHPVWIRAGGANDGRLLTVVEGDILELDGAGWVVTHASATALQARRETAADMWCRPEPLPAVELQPSRAFPVDELRDAAGHYRMRPKYTRGC